MNEPQLMMFEQINNNSGTELWTVKRPNFCQIGVLASETGCFKCASQGVMPPGTPGSSRWVGAHQTRSEPGVGPSLAVLPEIHLY